jgi:hypothetical protein
MKFVLKALRIVKSNEWDYLCAVVFNTIYNYYHDQTGKNKQFRPIATRIGRPKHLRIAVY